MNTFQQAVIFLTQFIFNTYIFLVLLGALLDWANVDPHNPISMLVARISQKPLAPLQKIIPSYKGIDLATIVFLLGLELLKLILISLLSIGNLPNLFGLIICAFAGLLNNTLTIFFYAIIIVSIISWFFTYVRHPILYILTQLTEPLLTPARKHIPPVGGVDLSPLVVLLVIKLLQIIIINPLLDLGITSAIS